MTPSETLAAAIEKLEQVKGSLGLVYLTSDDVLLVMADDDIDDDGNRFMFGVTVWDSFNPDYDREQSEAIVTLHATIDAQLDMLRLARGFYGAGITGPESATAFAEIALALADAVIGEPQ